MFAVCTESASAHDGLDVPFELSVHTGDTMQQEIDHDQGQEE
jgi:hypothetical protein